MKNTIIDTIDKLIKLPSLSRICFFSGSFNPPHAGHFKRAMITIEQGFSDFFIFCPHSHNEAKKKLFVDINHRISMLKIGIDETVSREYSHRILVCKPELINGLRNHAFISICNQLQNRGKIIVIALGSDALDKNYFQQLKRFFHVVYARGESFFKTDFDYSSFENGFVKIPIDLPDSSALIRSTLINNGSHPVSSINDYISKNHLYKEDNYRED
jgi:nicotinic acid mononucleotide adenylyltransferase